MSLSSDPRYRTITVTWANNDLAGGEWLQLWAKPASGVWGVVATFDAAAGTGSWDTALPVMAYDLALRYVNGPTPAVGYEGDPDAWTSPHAAGSMTTVDTSSAAVTFGTPGRFVDDATPITISWSSSQQDAPYRLEKSIDSGANWTTEVEDLVALSYQYTPAIADLTLDVQFRIRAKRDTVLGPLSSVLTVPVYVVVADTVIDSPSVVLDEGNSTFTFGWFEAGSALEYEVWRAVDAGAFSLHATTASLSYVYNIQRPGDPTHSIKFKVRGKNGAVYGGYSVTVSFTVPV